MYDQQNQNNDQNEYANHSYVMNLADQSKRMLDCRFDCLKLIESHNSYSITTLGVNNIILIYLIQRYLISESHWISFEFWHVYLIDYILMPNMLCYSKAYYSYFNFHLQTTNFLQAISALLFLAFQQLVSLILNFVMYCWATKCYLES